MEKWRLMVSGFFVGALVSQPLYSVENEVAELQRANDNLTGYMHTQGREQLNSVNQRPRALVPTPLDEETLHQEYRAYYGQQLALPGISSFVKAFPNL